MPQTRQCEIAQRVGFTSPPLQLDSLAKYGLIARGDARLYLRLIHPTYHSYREKIWDQAAGVLLVEEASGYVSDTNGRPLDFSDDGQMPPGCDVIVSATRSIKQAALNITNMYINSD